MSMVLGPPFYPLHPTAYHQIFVSLCFFFCLTQEFPRREEHILFPVLKVLHPVAGHIKPSIEDAGLGMQ